MDQRLETEVIGRRDNIVQSLLEWGKENFRDFPWRKKRTPYRILVAEIILRRTTAKAASRVYETLIDSYPSPAALSLAKVEKLEKTLSIVGYHKQRAKILKEVATFIVSNYNGKVPRQEDRLLEIPHVGQYIAGAVLSLGHGIPSAMVDSNIERIIRRLFSKHLSSKGVAKRVQEISGLMAPTEKNQVYNYALLDLGALICTYGLPRCVMCPLCQSCDYYLAGKPHMEKTSIRDTSQCPPKSGDQD